MKTGDVILCSEISKANALTLSRWLKDREICKYLSDGLPASRELEQAAEGPDFATLEYRLNRGGRFYLVKNTQGAFLGFVRLAVDDSAAEIVIAIGNRSDWGRGYGRCAIREVLKIVFFEMRLTKAVAKVHKENHRSANLFAGAGFCAESEGKELRSFILTMDEYRRRIRENAARPPELYLTHTDRDRLLLWMRSEHADRVPRETICDLEREIGRAKVVHPRSLPENVVSMYSRALISVNGKERIVDLTYRGSEESSADEVSVLSPVGAAILGYAEGDGIRWKTPAGMADIRIKKILYQPEAAGQFWL